VPRRRRPAVALCTRPSRPLNVSATPAAKVTPPAGPRVWSWRGGSVWLQVDGGVSDETIERCAEAGADVFVAGSAVYDADDPAAAVQALRAQAERATAHAAWAR